MRSHPRLFTLARLLLISLAGLALGIAPLRAQEASGDPAAQPAAVVWPAVGDHGWTLTVVLPSGAVVQTQFPRGAAPAFKLVDDAGQPRPDGTYQFQLTPNITVNAETRAALEAARAAGTEAAVVAQLQASGAFPAITPGRSGTFAVQAGQVVAPLAGERDPQPGLVTPQDVVVADDQIVQGSICAGFDCVDNESFGFDTLRLKENNLRIGIDDTSVGAFPANDWQLVFNDTASGGLSYFAVLDATNARTPFTLLAGAPTNAFYLNASGNLGLGTAAPVLELHLTDNDTPAIRMEQDNSGGFTAQTWDIGANEANFFVRDVTAGSRLPFRIRPGAPTSSLDIAASGNVGLGTTTPQARLHVMGNVLVEGNLTEFSDRNAKENFEAVDVNAVLRRLLTVPVYVWNYKADADEIRHMGPTAQDFYAAYALGPDDRHIAPLDLNGALLASAQALHQQVEAQAAEIAALEAQALELQRQLLEMAARLEKLEAAAQP